ncbi:MAG: site-specific integrase [Methanomassiliicoccales archaeon]
MAKDFQSLKEGGLIDTTDPTRMTEKEISAYLRLQRSRGLSESGQAHNISALRSILRFCGNPVLDKMRMEYGSMLPKMRSKRQSPLEVPDLETIYRTASNVSDWRRLQAYALVILALNTGLRTKELRTAKVGDIDKDSWSLTVKHPKGEGTYGEERKVPILPPAKTIIRRYLVARAEIVSSYAPLNEALFPAMKDKGDGYYTGNGLRKLKSIVERETRVDLDFRACRRTFGQTCVDKGVQIESVSIALGHSSTKTTEGYYCRKREDTALREIYSAWKEEIPTSAIKPLIEKDKYFSGYA